MSVKVEFKSDGPINIKVAVKKPVWRQFLYY